MTHPSDIMDAKFIRDMEELVKAAKSEPVTRKIRPNGKTKGSDFQPITEVV